MADLEVYKNLSPEKGKTHTTNFKVSVIVLVKDSKNSLFYFMFS
jgi:hypothetical protein